MMEISKYTDQYFTLGEPKDLAEKLGEDGIKNLLGIICEAYRNLLNSEKKHSMDELAITEELFVEIQKIWVKANISLIPIHEKSHERKKGKKGKTPAIDFCFRDDWKRDSYFGAECKILEEKNTNHYDLYVTDGVCRYLSGKYGEKCSVGSMIGYVIFGDTANIVDEIKIRVNKLSDVSEMQQTYPIGSFTEHYESMHEREVGCSPFQIHHLFFSFVN